MGDQEVTGHRISVQVIEASHVKATNYFGGESDCFVELNVKDGIKKSTEVAFKSLTPKWNETHVLELDNDPHSELLFVTVWGRHLIGRNTFVGRCEIPLSFVLPDHPAPPCADGEERPGPENGEVVERWFKLQPVAGATGKKAYDAVPGYIRLGLQYLYAPEVIPQPDSAADAPAPPAPAGQPPNTTLYYQCPMCSQLFLPDVISSHMALCTQRAAAPGAASAVQSSLPAPSNGAAAGAAASAASASGSGAPAAVLAAPGAAMASSTAPIYPPAPSTGGVPAYPTRTSPPQPSPPSAYATKTEQYAAETAPPAPKDAAPFLYPMSSDPAYLQQAPPPPPPEEDAAAAPPVGTYGYGAPTDAVQPGAGEESPMVQYYRRLGEMDQGSQPSQEQQPQAPQYPQYDAQYA